MLLDRPEISHMCRISVYNSVCVDVVLNISLNRQL